MIPSNLYLDPYSQNKGQIPYPPYQFYPYPVPNGPDPSEPASYAPRPYHFNPTNSNSYSYPPGYYGPRPPFPYELPPPNFPNYYNPYFPPMPSYPAKYPQVDHTTSQTHCCGCPNHVCHRTDSQNVRIDEEKPDMDPTKMPNNTYPFFWFSPRNKVQLDEIEKPKKEIKEAQFPWPLVWRPEDEIKDEKKDKQFPWPIIWMPEDDAKEMKDQHANKLASEEAAKPSFRIIPLKFLEHGDKDHAEMQKFPVMEKKHGSDEAGKEQRDHGHKDQAEVKKIIPVLEKREGSEKIGKEEPVKVEVSTGNKVTERKHSKLPPVCLRVDPLPHKRSTNVSTQNKKDVKVVDVKSVKDEIKKDVKVVDVKSVKDDRKERGTEGKRDLEEKLEERKVEDFRRVRMPEEEKIKKEIKVSDARGAKGKELKEREIQGEDQREKFEKRTAGIVKKSQISEKDAALLIQSVYRGYNVRRWDPLEKLKKIRSVHEKAQELLAKLQHVEKSAIQLEKEQLVLSESIMNLLLQLDTVQGLHPTVREARKSVARELVSLQEKLDSEKRKVVEAPTNKVQHLQLEDQPTASTISSVGCKAVSEQVDLQESEAPTMECMKTEREDKKCCHILKKEDAAAKLDVPQPQAAIDFHSVDTGSTPEESQVTPVLDETFSTSEESLATQVLEETCSMPKGSQLTPVPEETELAGLLPDAIASNDKAQLSPQTENSQNVGSTGNVELHATGVVPRDVTKANISDMASPVSLSESGTDASHVLSESEMNDTVVTSSVTEEICDTVIAADVAVTDGFDKAATHPETQHPDGVGCEEEIHVHATESNAKDAQEAAAEVTMNETATKEIDLQEALVTQEEIHDTVVALDVVVSDGFDKAATHPENQNLDGVGCEEGIHVHATENDAKDAEGTAAEVTLNESATKEVDLQEAAVTQESCGSDAGASMEQTELQSIEVGEPSSEENKMGGDGIASESPVTVCQEGMHATEVVPEESHVNDGCASAKNVQLPATRVGKSEENKSKECQVIAALPENENPDGKSEEYNEAEAEVHLDLTQTNAMEAVPEVEVTDRATGVGQFSLEEKKLVEENEKLRIMLEKLMEAGRNQLHVISGLNERVKGLEKKLERKKSKKSKVRVMKHKPVMASLVMV